MNGSRSVLDQSPWPQNSARKRARLAFSLKVLLGLVQGRTAREGTPSVLGRQVDLAGVRYLKPLSWAWGSQAPQGGITAHWRGGQLRAKHCGTATGLDQRCPPRRALDSPSRALCCLGLLPKNSHLIVWNRSQAAAFCKKPLPMILRQLLA